MTAPRRLSIVLFVSALVASVSFAASAQRRGGGRARTPAPAAAPNAAPPIRCETAEDCESRCLEDRSNTELCMAAGGRLRGEAERLLLRGPAREHFYRRVSLMYDIACEHGSTEGCFATYYYGMPTHPDFLRFVERACSQGTLVACVTLAELHTPGSNRALPAATRARALELHAAACDRGAIESCRQRAGLVRSENPVEGRALLDRTCRMGDVDALKREERGVITATMTAAERADVPMRSAFAASNLSAIAMACRSVAEMHESGEGGAADTPMAIAAYERSHAARSWSDTRDAAARLRGAAAPAR